MYEQYSASLEETEQLKPALEWELQEGPLGIVLRGFAISQFLSTKQLLMIRYLSLLVALFIFGAQKEEAGLFEVGK